MRDELYILDEELVGVNIIIVKNYEQMSHNAADIVDDFLRNHRPATLGLPTGKTPKGMYEVLVRKHREEHLDFSQVTTFNLDEYRGLPPDHPASFARYIKENFLELVNVAPERAWWPSGTGDEEAACRAYDDAIDRAGGLDLVILGIGANGHIGFNEPGTPFHSRTHIARLAEQTRRIAATDGAFAHLDDVPQQAITMGMQTMMDARRVLLVASGAGKADAVAGAVSGPVTEQLPASVLQRHPDVTIVVDEAASARLPKRAS